MDLEFFWDIGNIVIRAFISVCFLFIITRLMGKKQISQFTHFDYVIGISIGSIASEMASTTEIPFTHTITAMIIYTAVAITISVITNKSIFARRFFTGRTFILIDQGKILEKNLSKVKYDVNDLLSQARNAGYFNIADIHYALLETNGKISFMPVADKQPPTLGDLNIIKNQEALTCNVIIDGEIMIDNLNSIGLNTEWLKSTLKKQNVISEKNIILATVDTEKNLKVYHKTKKLKLTTPLD